MYKLYIRPDPYYSDKMRNKRDPEFELDFAQRLESVSQWLTYLSSLKLSKMSGPFSLVKLRMREA